MVRGESNWCLTIGRKPIERISTIIYMDVLLDEHLNDYVTYIHASASSKLGILWKPCEYLCRSTSTLLYKSLVRPHLEYCNLIYICTTACRTILKSDERTMIMIMHRHLCLLTLKQWQDLHIHRCRSWPCPPVSRQEQRWELKIRIWSRVVNAL